MKLLRKFKPAFSGLVDGFHQPSILLQVALALAAVVFFGWLQIGFLQWLLVIVMIALVWLSEWVNSIVEALVDHISTATSPQAKKIKDLSAGLVLLAGFLALIVGVLIIIDRFS